ncbi:MAG: hypothetical protein HGJ93_00685 [Desulfosarcina sp.]|nr:hypothetical protein [Desulfosarcina sp.]MBC2764502.1 hypothetical protein [Desulfosarcina sp.]
MSETRETIRIRAQRILGTAINATINEAIREYHKTLQRMHDYRFMDASTTISVSAGDDTFALPADFKAPINPEMSDSDGTGYRRMKRIIKDGIESRSTDDEGRPLMYRIFNGTGYLYGKANEDYTFMLEYVKWLPELTSDDAPTEDNAEFLDAVHKAIEFYAIAEGKRRINQLDVADYWENKAEAKRIELQLDDIDYELAATDLQMEIEG